MMNRSFILPSMSRTVNEYPSPFLVVVTYLKTSLRFMCWRDPSTEGGNGDIENVVLCSPAVYMIVTGDDKGNPF